MVFCITMRDYHIHTSLCKHAEGEMEQYVEAAISRGITELCFTDHIPFPDNFDLEHRMATKEMDIYLENIERCKAQFPGINILTGIEADYLEGYEKYLEEFLARYSFDMVIMSVHFIKKWGDKGWVFSYEYTDKTVKQQYSDYFDCVLKGVQTGLFDVMGHFDIIKRLKNPVLDTNREQVEQALDAINAAGMSLELNTSGWRKFIEETYPAPEILDIVVDKEIPIVLSSDAHKPEQVGFCFKGIMPQLYENYPGMQLAFYRERKATIYPLIQSGNR
jgi:histidinol-phosphatase (PHP family)